MRIPAKLLLVSVVTFAFLTACSMPKNQLPKSTGTAGVSEPCGPTDVNGSAAVKVSEQGPKRIQSGAELEAGLPKISQPNYSRAAKSPLRNKSGISAAEEAKEAGSGVTAKYGDSLAAYMREEQVKVDKFFGPLPPINHLKLLRHYKVKGVYIGNGDNLSEIISLVKNTEINSVVINVKSDSYFHYPTENIIARKAGVSIVGNDELAQRIQKLKDQGIRVIGKISCFRDTLLARNYPEFAVKDKENRVINWSNEGEASFVNPYNINVWRYIRDCCYEAVDLGCDELLLDQVRFPFGVAANEVGNVYYGEKEDLPDKPAAIARFLEFMRVELSDKLGVPLSASLFDVHSKQGELSSGQSYRMFSSCGLDSITPILFPSDYANASPWSGNGVGTEINGQLFKAPDLDPYGVISATANYYLSNFSKQGSTFYRPYLQAFTAGYLPRNYWHKYTPAEIAKQIKALNDSGLDEYILWNGEAHYSREIFTSLAGEVTPDEQPTVTSSASGN